MEEAQGECSEDRDMVYAPPKRKLTVDEYQRMGEAGIFHEDDRVELLDGELYEMTPIGDDHIGNVIDLTQLFVIRLGGRALVSIQNPIQLSDYSEPQPDVVLLRPRADSYRKGKARPADVLLLIEVARTSLDYDRMTKLPRYAAAGIVEVWIVNLVNEQVEVYRLPSIDEYSAHSVFGRGEVLAPAALPDVAIGVDEILR
jgi:Uma2 family endonuclease